MTHRNREINKMKTIDRKDILIDHIKEIKKINKKYRNNKTYGNTTKKHFAYKSTPRSYPHM